MLTINPRVAISVLLVTLIGLGIGTWADDQWPNALGIPAVVVGVGAGIMFGFALGLYIVHQRRRWIAVAALATFLLIVLVSGGVGSTVLAIASIVLTFVVTAGVLRDLYGGSEIAAIKNQLSIMTSIRGGFVVVTGGKIAVPSTQPPHLGPKLVIVRPGNLVVMINGGAISRICGPSVFMSKNFEYVGDVIVIEKQTKTLSIGEVVTADIDPVTVQVRYNYGVKISEATIRGENGGVVHGDDSRGLTADELATVRNVIARNPRWAQDIHAHVESAVRSMVAQCEYHQLVGANHYQRLVRRIGYAIEKPIADLGGLVESVNVVNITPNSDLLSAHIEGQRTRNIEFAKGDGFRMAITEIAKGYRTALTLSKDMELRLGKSISVEDIHQMATRFMMEQMAEDPATKVVLPAPRYSLEDIQGPASIADDAIDGAH